MLLSLIEIFAVILPVLLGIAYLTLAERKIMGSMQRRVGPNHIGLFGLLQPLSDGIKLLLKETIFPSQSDKIFFISAPLIIFTVNLLGWATIPFGEGNSISDMELGIIYLLAMSSISVVGIILAGWSGNSKYSLMGSLRTTAQLISYELVIGLTILTIIGVVGSYNLNEIILFQKHSIIFLLPLLPLFPILFISALAETNRVPFDLVESESELVSGAFTEYSSFSFALIFLVDKLEYGAMISMCTLINILFLGGYLVPFSYLFSDFLLIFLEPLFLGLKTCLLLFIFIWVRATLPRVKFNQLINLNWKCLLPITLGLFMLVISLLILIFPIDNINIQYLFLPFIFKNFKINKKFFNKFLILILILGFLSFFIYFIYISNILTKNII
ncbi:respiratory-chain NADH dehydrogenase [Coemansia reversa NRRL 1564]|uniref:Respiratory-chain NADH dehydrogenase n=1 Tax=Coemansia reversa (strain ATCC 12441 / NRRL 1564) TaxID=763665 RepID=A0A2G5B1G2_COERN|nr:respiratory-chain NADH dehydrogenase [Coemansia reversa NRRL 1564]|eukprot:PIA12841.1 respiratory-chain NADH dehydrogenase [Coemansia reversa NRRL 1564]